VRKARADQSATESVTGEDGKSYPAKKKEPKRKPKPVVVDERPMLSQLKPERQSSIGGVSFSGTSLS
jgi:hypothetical protein